MPFCFVQEWKEKERWSQGAAKALCLSFQELCQVKWVLEQDKHWQEPASGNNGEAGSRKLSAKPFWVNMDFMWGQDVLNQAGMLRAQTVLALQMLLVAFTHMDPHCLAADRSKYGGSLQRGHCRALTKSTIQLFRGREWHMLPNGQEECLLLSAWHNFSNAWTATSVTRLTLTYLGTLGVDLCASGLKPVLPGQLGT